MSAKTRRLVSSALLAALICVLAPMSLPIGPVPISLATFAIYLASSLAGAKRAAIAVFVYILLGALGVPVFSGFTGGFQRIVGATGGYIVGYLPCALLTGFVVDRYREKSALAYPLGMLLGTIVLYSLGTVWFILATQNSLAASLAICVLPFVPFDALKITAVSLLAPRVRSALDRKEIKHPAK